MYIFGAGEISKFVVEYFYKMQYKVKGIISRQKVDCIFGIKNYSIDSLSDLKKYDVIIIVPSYDFENICDELSDKTEAHMISIEHILDLTII